MNNTAKDASMERVPIRLPRSLKIEAERIAADRGLSLSAWIRTTLSDAVKREARPTPQT